MTPIRSYGRVQLKISQSNHAKWSSGQGPQFQFYIDNRQIFTCIDERIPPNDFQRLFFVISRNAQRKISKYVHYPEGLSPTRSPLHHATPIIDCTIKTALEMRIFAVFTSQSYPVIAKCPQLYPGDSYHLYLAYKRGHFMCTFKREITKIPRDIYQNSLEQLRKTIDDHFDKGLYGAMFSLLHHSFPQQLLSQYPKVKSLMEAHICDRALGSNHPDLLLFTYNQMSVGPAKDAQYARIQPWLREFSIELLPQEGVCPLTVQLLFNRLKNRISILLYTSATQTKGLLQESEKRSLINQTAFFVHKNYSKEEIEPLIELFFENQLELVGTNTEIAAIATPLLHTIFLTLASGYPVNRAALFKFNLILEQANPEAVRAFISQPFAPLSEQQQRRFRIALCYQLYQHSLKIQDRALLELSLTLFPEGAEKNLFLDAHYEIMRVQDGYGSTFFKLENIFTPL